VREVGLRLLQDRFGNTCQLGYFQSITSFHTAGQDFLEKNNIMISLVDTDMIVVDIIKGISKCNEFVIVSRQEDLTTDRRRKMLDNRSRNTQSIIGTRPTTEFIKNHKTMFGRIIDDIGDFDHLGHEGRLIFGDDITASYSRKDSIDESDLRFTRWYAQSTMCQQYNQSMLPQERRFTSHIWSGDDMDSAINTQIIGYKRVRHWQMCLDHRMSSSDDMD
jgi:hypothetical protein